MSKEKLKKAGEFEQEQLKKFLRKNVPAIM